MGVRARLTLVATALTGVVLVLASAVLLWVFREAQVDASDDVARGRLSELVTRVEVGEIERVVADVDDDGFAQVVTDGRVVAASSSLGHSGPVSDWRPAPGRPVVRDLDDVADDDETEDYRVWATTLDDGATTAYVGTAREALAEDVRVLVVTLALGFPVLMVAAGGLLWVLVGRTLSPVALAHERQRAFVADAAHELQSPLASYRAQLEVALADPATDWPDTARSLLGDSDRMERLVRDLLFLARQEGSARPLSPLDLDDVVLEEVARVRPSTTVDIGTGGVSAAPVRGDRDDLARLVRNLLANAVRHAGSSVEVGCRVDADRVLLSVTDDGPGVPPDERVAVFERFHRGDAAHAHDGGTGLGLSIVAAVATRHGGAVVVEDAWPGARFVVSLPVA